MYLEKIFILKNLNFRKLFLELNYNISKSVDLTIKIFQNYYMVKF